ncbi:hypothetical protein, partial [Klebsiella pneumoniae]|uniref:hypothetical protein n=1 Tax=Klebsiella pneumoniae TaxID=573 RepID=UPI0022AC8FCD
IDHNISGLLVAPENINGLANSLLGLINLSNIEYEKMSSNAVESSVRYSVNPIVKQWLSIIK